MADERRIPWSPISPLPHINGSVEPLLRTVDSLRAAWDDALRAYSADELKEARNRRLRRHAVETGIIERLYDLDWGTTEALVAEGLTMEAANRSGGIHEDTLLVIRSQYDALEYLTELVGTGHDLSVLVIRELHQLITRNQLTYEARDALGRPVRAPLRHGEWKLQPNHVRRSDGSLLEYCPPEQVQPEMERLVWLYDDAKDEHPIVRSAWLHHRFIQIHPFEDGNGRVARAITLLVLLRDHYAPLVVDRRQRETYISALDAANNGDLGDLVRFFVQLEIAALQSTLTQPITSVAEPDAAGVVRTYARRLREIRNATLQEKTTGVTEVANETAARIAGYLEEQRVALQESLREIDPDSSATLRSAEPPSDEARWWRRQLVQTAKIIDFYTNLSEGSWWSRLRLNALGVKLRFLVAVQKAGHGDSGVLTVTVYADLVHQESEETVTAVEPEPVLDLSPTDSVTLAYNDSPAERWPDIEDLLKDKLREAVNGFVNRLG